MLLAGSVFGQAPPSPPGPAVEKVTPEAIQSRRQQAEQATDLDEATKQKVLQTYTQAAAMLDAAAKSAARVVELQKTIESAAARIEVTNRDLAAVAAQSPVVPAGNEDLATVRQTRTEKEAALAKAKETLAALEAEAARRVSGRTEIPGLIAAGQGHLTKLSQDLLTPLSPDTPPAAVLAQRSSLLAQRQAVEQSIAAYQKELASYDATAELLPLQQRLAAARVGLLENEVKKWREVENRLAEIEAARQAEQARWEAISADPALKPYADENTALAELAKETAKKIRSESDSQAKVTAELEDVKKKFQQARDRVETIGLTVAIGLSMRTRRAELADENEYYESVRARQNRIRNVQTRLFDLADQQSDDVKAKIERSLSEPSSVGTRLSPEEMEAAIGELLARREEYLQAAITAEDSYLQTLVNLDNTERQLIHQIEQYADYIDERVLWIQSNTALRFSDLRLAGGVVKSGLSPRGWEAWGDVSDALYADLQEQPFPVALALALLAVWLYAQRRLRIWIEQSGQTASQSAQQRIAPTLQALVATLLVATIWPAVVWYLARRIASPLEASDFAQAVAAGLNDAARWWLPLELLRQICRTGGLGEAHFGWPPGSLLVLRRHLRWFVIAGLPMVFLAGMMETQGIERWQYSLGRLSFMATMLLQIALVQMVLRPSGRLFRHFLAEGRRGWFFRGRHFCYWLGILAPSAFFIAAGVGYFYTAQRLSERLRETVLLVLLLAVVGALLSRWVLVIRRRLAIQQARQRRASAQASGEVPGEQPSILAVIPTAEDLKSDLTTVSEQTRRLLRSFLFLATVVGIWWIWVEVFPALTILEEVELWSTTVLTNESVPGAEDSGLLRTVERAKAITLADLGLGLLVLLMTVIAAKNVPGLLEISIPQRLPLDAGTRYAVTMITRYVIITVGVVLGFGAVGIGWSKVQWLIAALSVGLGFGLQEIFANFVSGLIILFEQPIRVGDVVTVEDISGVVTRIQTRATIVTNWDRKELIVPNKEFITGRLLNWTRADKVNRIVITVGIAYGSDTQRAYEILWKLINEHPEVMDDPAPLVTFEEFGDSSLNFVVRCYLPKLDNRLMTIHELHMAIDREFRAAGIEIAFPQCDIHIRSDAGLSRNPPTDETR
jgi:potassium efflux system protein